MEASAADALEHSRKILSRPTTWVSILIAALFGQAGIALANGAGLSITGYDLIQMQRLDRFNYQLHYQAHVENSGASMAQGVTATLTTSNPATRVVDNQVSFGDVAANSGKDSTDTFILNHDRRQRLSTGDWSWTFQSTNPGTNHNPQITSTPITSATLGQAYGYQVTATDQDPGDTLTDSLTTYPTGMQISSGGLLSWTPVAGQEGTQPVTVRVEDNHGGFTTQSWVINVQAGGGGGGLPPDPATVAPPLDPTVSTTTFASSEFLYTGDNPIQTGAAPGHHQPGARRGAAGLGP